MLFSLVLYPNLLPGGLQVAWLLELFWVAFIYLVALILVLFFSFAVNQWLQYRRIGAWADYIRGEKTYLVLSLVAKSVLAWQIYGGSLSPE